MSYEQPDPYLCSMQFGKLYPQVFKEHPDMDDERNSGLFRQDRNAGQRLRGIYANVDSASDDEPLTLAHADCNDGNQSGMGLRHSPRYERPHKHDLTRNIC